MTSSQFLTEREAAALLNLAHTTLSRWRWSGRGPKFVKFGGAVRYPVEGIRQFISEGES